MMLCMSATKTPILISAIDGENDFYQSINAAISKGRHAEYLSSVLAEYEWYKTEFSKVFSHTQPSGSIYLFHVVYKLKHGVSRDIEILGNQSYEKLARIIVKSMGWQYDHMHGFTVVGPKRKPYDSFMVQKSQLEFFAPNWNDDPYPTYKSSKIKINQINYTKYPRIEFIFDFGDGHRFDIKFVKERKVTLRDGKKKFPQLFDQCGIGPEQYPDADE